MRNQLVALACVALLSACAGMKKGTWQAETAAGNTAADAKTGLLKTAWGTVKMTPVKVDKDGFYVKVEIKNTSSKPVEYLRKYVELVDTAGGSHVDQDEKQIANGAANTAVSAASKGWSIGNIAAAAAVAVRTSRAIARNGTIAPGATHEDELSFGKDLAWGSFSFRFSKDLIGANAKNDSIKFSFVEEK